MINDRFRLLFRIPFDSDSFHHTFETTQKPDSNGTEPLLNDSTKLTFVKYPGFQSTLITDFSEELNNLTITSLMFHTTESKDLTKYNKWNFTDAAIWDGNDTNSFWWSNETQ